MNRVMVTGATRAPGRNVATALAKKGWEVHALGRDRIALEEMRGDFGICPMAMDLTDRDYVRLVAEGLQLDAIVHAALRWPEEGSFLRLAEADIDMALEVNLSATLHLTRAIVPSMIAQGYGTVIMIAPSSADRSTFLERSLASAISGVSDALRHDLVGTGVSVHSVSFDGTNAESLGQEAIALLAGADTPANYDTRKLISNQRQERKNGT
ncbi:SDR family oxidoreductase [Rhizobium sp. NPDC090275]|uniref:SDR family oxidoreductase n=1 Tax=Rhizobium sp. NPDC090275 TaxID=3364498 RepID=UPI00383A537D